MILLVNDANIIIDLLKIDLLSEFFQLSFEFHLTDLVAGEIKEKNAARLQAYMDSGTLKKKSFTYEELSEIQLLKIKHKGLSVKDCSCLFHSKALSARLITGDALLRKIAEQDDIKAHGMIWIFDQMVKQQVITKIQAHEKLSYLMAINPRLPKAECKKRLNLWK